MQQAAPPATYRGIEKPLTNAVPSPPGEQGKCVISPQTQLSMRSLLHTLAFSKKVSVFSISSSTPFASMTLNLACGSMACCPPNHRLWPALRSGAWSPAAVGGCQSFLPPYQGWLVALLSETHSLPQGLFSNFKLAVNPVLSLGLD